MRPDPYAWTAHAEATAAIAILVGGYLYAIRTHATTRWRIASFAAATCLLLATAVTPLDGLSYHLLTAHLLQNVVLAEWAPALLVLGVPPRLAEQLARLRGVRLLTRPVVSLPLWLATYFAWHVPAAYDAALENVALIHVEHASYLVAGCLLWWPVLQDEPWRLPSPARAAYLFVAFVLASPVGLLLALLPNAIYDFYADGAGLWGLSPLADQQLAGATMAIEQAVVFFAAFTFFFFRFLGEQERADQVA